MARQRGIAITSFGERDIDGLLANIRAVTDLPVHILSEKNCNVRWRGSPRWGQRNSDLHKATAVLSLRFDSVLILDDDMRIVNRSFEEGFELAERFGTCLPVNPRVFAGIDASIGADVSPATKVQLTELPTFSTACNMGTIFVDKTDNRSVALWHRYRKIMSTNPCRGPVAMWRAIWDTYTPPYFLPAEWCVCAADARRKYCKHGQVFIPPMILHVGHPEVMQWYRQDPFFESFRNAESMDARI